MAPYISSHLRDRVSMLQGGPYMNAPQLDILQNLVANTRTPRSAMTATLVLSGVPFTGPPIQVVADRAQSI